MVQSPCRGSACSTIASRSSAASPICVARGAVDRAFHPDDAAELGIASVDRVVLRSRRGEAALCAGVTAAVQRGQLFTAMHHEAANRLTLRALDPHSRQPAYKHCAVSIARAPA